MRKMKPGLMSLIGALILTANLYAGHDPFSDYSKIDDGIIIRLNHPSWDGARLLRLQAVSDNIIHVTASPADSFTAFTSLMVPPLKRNAPKWEVSEKDGELFFETAGVVARINTQTGAISYFDRKGNPLLKEVSGGGRHFWPVTVEGQPAYSVSQFFEAAADEAFYGLGQHQNGIMNYRGTQVELLQNNTDVAIPFLLSTRRYGLLWDNYSITRVIDSRKNEPLSRMQLYSAKGEPGWLTATYRHKYGDQKVLVQRPESDISYEFLPDMKKWPEGVKMENTVVSWEGSLASDRGGCQQFQIKYGGYLKIWINDSLYANRWRQSWNPGSMILRIPFEAGRKYRLRMEWDPDGGESYLVCRWLPPLPDDEAGQFSFASEIGQQLNYYVIYGNTMDEVISGYRDLTGKSPILPRWAMGLWQSRERYKTQQEILDVVKTFRNRGIPLDNIVLDWSYWKEDAWGSQDFDESRFPDPKGMIDTLHQQWHTHFMISVWPKFYEGIGSYRRFNDSGWLYPRNVANRQRDWIGKGYISTFYDAFNPNARKGFWNLLNDKLYSKGVDAWWLDATEPDIHSNAPIAERKQLMSPTYLGPGAEYFNAYPLLNAAGIYDGQRSDHPDKRVFILTRSAYAGQQRYAAATWSGDISATWGDFHDQISAGVNFSMSGIPWWTVDIGGFAVQKKFEEAKGDDLEQWRALMTRWYQFGAFCPLFRVHGQYPYREIFNIAPPEHPAYRSMLYYDKLRYRLLPYIYTLAGDTYWKNYTLMRGLVMDFPNDTVARNINDQYLFGPDMLVSPVYEPGATSRRLYLPGETGWYDFYTGKFEQGGKWLDAPAPMEQIPLFIRAGSILPVGPELQYSGEKAADTITLFVYTGADAHFSLYEDGGLDYSYESGAFARIPMDYHEQGHKLTIGNREGAYPGMLSKRIFRVVWISANRSKGYNPLLKADKVLRYEGRALEVTMPD